MQLIHCTAVHKQSTLHYLTLLHTQRVISHSFNNGIKKTANKCGLMFLCSTLKRTSYCVQLEYFTAHELSNVTDDRSSADIFSLKMAYCRYKQTTK